MKRVEDKDLLRWVVQERDRVCLFGLFGKVKLHGCFGGLDPHHIIKRSQLGPDDKRFIVTLCRGHHDDAEARRISTRELLDILVRLYGYTYTEEELRRI